MEKNLIIKEGKKSSYYFAIICLFLSIIWASQTQSYAALAPLIFVLSTAVLSDMIMNIRWFLAFAVFLDLDKQEVILNHTLFFNKKKILFKDIKEVDILNGNIILDASFPLSKWQRAVCKTKMSNDYTVRFETIDACERRHLIETVKKGIL